VLVLLIAPALAELLALFDALRSGSAREQALVLTLPP
jgi:hypothetical protein